MKSLLKSRKFKLTMGAVLLAVGAAVMGEVTWAQAVWASMTAFAVNVLGIAIEDGAEKISKPLSGM